VITIVKDAQPTVLHALIIVVFALNAQMERWIRSPITLVAAISENTLPLLLFRLMIFQELSSLYQLVGLLVINPTEP
jgi:hypothetical protein